MTNYIIFNRDDYKVTFIELTEWALQTGFNVWAISAPGGNKSQNTYAFDTPEAFTAFKLRFPSKKPETPVDIDFFETDDL